MNFKINCLGGCDLLDKNDNKVNRNFKSCRCRKCATNISGTTCKDHKTQFNIITSFISNTYKVCILSELPMIKLKAKSIKFKLYTLK